MYLKIIWEFPNEFLIGLVRVMSHKPLPVFGKCFQLKITLKMYMTSLEPHNSHYEVDREKVTLE